MTGVNRRDFLRVAGAGSAALALPLTTAAGRAVAKPAGPTDLKATVSASGAWQVKASVLDWTFSGSVGSAITGIATRSGLNAVGSYTETTFTFQAGARKGGIRVYHDASSVVFTDTFVEAGANGNPFPTFTDYPNLAHQLSHRGKFAQVQFNTFAGASDSPWVFFDDKGSTFILSAANHFQEAKTSKASDGSIAAGVISSIATLPAGYTRQTILSANTGIGAAHRAWGSALTRLAGKQLPTNDDGIILSTLGYWTDNGADYYYKFDQSKGYAGTLLAVRDEWASKKVPMGYMQLDSWWYRKGPNGKWNDGQYGISLYEADKQLFPDGLSAFQKQLGMPLVTHARWIDKSSPYHSQYQFSDDVIVDLAYWQSVMDYLKDSGVAVYEQDWLDDNAMPAENLTDADQFFDNMAHQAAAHGIDVQYCMALPRDYLQTTRYPNVTTIRASNDRMHRGNWDTFLYDSQFAGALGVWPWTDIFKSSEIGNLLLATLSAGPVGVGDALGKVNAGNLFQAVRPDGIIVKPDVPIVPTDATYVGQGAGKLSAMVASTHVAHATGLTYRYVFAYARQLAVPQEIYQAENATLSGPIVGTGNSGYTGTGFADYQHADGDYVEWTVQAPAAGTYTLQFRYANGSADRPLGISVNGGNTGNLSFPSTGSWNNWSQARLTTTLHAGTNTVRATAVGANGANIDWLGVTQGEVPNGMFQKASFTLAEIGETGSAYVYDYFAGSGALVTEGGQVSADVTDGTYWVVAPIGPSGIAFLGDKGKFVAHGHKRLEHLSDHGSVRATVAFAAEEGPVTLHGYAPHRPSATATHGSVGTVGYDAATKLFSVTVSAGRGDRAVIKIEP
ncbi:carbohydrate-binding protein [Streptomyces sp. NPDC056227]|uniref:carbohydrate-binding protein n=1 Tax=Streptomyces sp. NPDC056227 TaxID=3345753 RepID=UPI0035D80040